MGEGEGRPNQEPGRSRRVSAMTSNEVSWTFRSNTMSILVIRLAILLSALICLEAASRTVAVDPEGRAIEKLAAAMHDPDQRDESRAALKSIIGDMARKPGHRVQAIHALGAEAASLGEWEVFDYFVGIAEDPRGIDPERQLQAAALFQYSVSRVAREADLVKQLEILRSLLTARYGKFSMTLVNQWAAKELCNRGDSQALTEMDRVFKVNRSQDFEINSTVCRLQIALLNKYPTRHESLVRALTWQDNLTEQIGRNVQEWAIEGLGALGNPEADQSLLDFAIRKQAESATPSSFTQGVKATAELVRNGWSFERLAAAGLGEQIIIYAGAVPAWVMKTSETTPPK